jgi:aspartyl-tRNA(Asn)/glutamyl-tRNA(Gln) amidotransferase subunit C
VAKESPTVTPEVVRKVADLARLAVPEADLPVWSAQLARIVGYIEQIAAVPAGEAAPAGPPTPLRADVPRPGGGLEALEANAPKRFRGYGVVPRVVGSAP